MTIKLSVPDDEGGAVQRPAPPSRLRRVLLWLLYGAGAAVMVLVLTPWLGLWWALPIGVVAFAVYLILPAYRGRY